MAAKEEANAKQAILTEKDVKEIIREEGLDECRYNLNEEREDSPNETAVRSMDGKWYAYRTNEQGYAIGYNHPFRDESDALKLFIKLLREDVQAIKDEEQKKREAEEKKLSRKLKKLFFGEEKPEIKTAYTMNGIYVRCMSDGTRMVAWKDAANFEKNFFPVTNGQFMRMVKSPKHTKEVMAYLETGKWPPLED